LLRKIEHRSIRVNYKTQIADVFDGRADLKFSRLGVWAPPDDWGS